MKKAKRNAKIEIVTNEHELSNEIVKFYEVEPKLVAKTDYFTIFSLTITRSTNKRDLLFLDQFVENQDIVCYEWSRPIKITLDEEDQKEIEDLFLD